MTSFRLPPIHSNLSSRDAQDYVIVLSRSNGGTRFTYVMIDPMTRTLTPKFSTVIWARLGDIVHFATCVHKNCLYVLGGIEKSTGKVCRHAHKYDPYLGRWKQIEDMTSPRARHAAASIFGKVYVFGGIVSETQVTDTTESYEPLTDEWQKDEKLPEPRKDHACVVRDNSVYIVGGASATQVANDNVWVLSRTFPDPTRPSFYVYEWSSLSDPRQDHLAYRLARPNVVVCNDRLYVFGGICHGQTANGKRVLRCTPLPAQNISLAGQSTDQLKWMIGTSPALEAYNLKSSIRRPEMDELDAQVQEAVRHREDQEREERKRKLGARKKLCNRRMKGEEKKQALAQIEAEELAIAEEVDRIRIEDEDNERRNNKSRWKANLPDMTQARCSGGTVVIGNKIYLIGGHSVEDDSMKSINRVEYFHTRRKEWVEAFEIESARDLADVDCCILTVPKTNRDFKPMRFTGCKWVMW